MNVGALKRILENLPDEYEVYIPRDNNWDYYNLMTTSMVGFMEYGEFVEDVCFEDYKKYNATELKSNCVVLAN